MEHVPGEREVQRRRSRYRAVAGRAPPGLSGRAVLAAVAAGAAPGGQFLWDFQQTVLRWARWARDEVLAWPEDLSQVDAAAEFARIVAAAGDPLAGPGRAEAP